MNSLNIIHVSGTKGKGSTCAFTESILRSHGFKTGFYSSPHLIAVRERIRINGRPLSEEKFTKYFWNTYNCIKFRRSGQGGSKTDSPMVADAPFLPPYFMFLTVMAMNVFVKEQVDLAVIEVGIGGEFDCTNFITRPVVVGVTSLGLDHTAILGDTIQRIAWNKSGIFKERIPALTVEQEPAAMNVLVRRSREKNSTLEIVPGLDEYKILCQESGRESVPDEIKLGIRGDVQKVNGSLAVRLCQKWLQVMRGCEKRINASHHLSINGSHQDRNVLTQEFLTGLANCTWPGRCHTLTREVDGVKIKYFLDGAHTYESINTCLSWYKDASCQELTVNGNSSDRQQLSVRRVLLFNCTGNRDAEKLLIPFLHVPFDVVTFSTNKLKLNKSKDSDNSNFTIDEEEEIKKVLGLRQLWERLKSGKESFDSADAVMNTKTDASESIKAFQCLSQAVRWIESNSGFESNISNQEHTVHILVTGSLHLVGGVLELLDPNLNSCS